MTLRAGTRSLGRMRPLTLIVGSRNYSAWSLRAWMLLRHLGLEFAEQQVPLDTPEFEAELVAEHVTHRIARVLYGTPRVAESSW